MDVSTVLNTVDVLKSAGIEDITLIMDKGMFTMGNISSLVSSADGRRLRFIMSAKFTLSEIKHAAIISGRTVGRGSNMMKMGGEIVFSEMHKLNISGNEINAWIYYQPDRDKEERSAFYRNLYDRVERLEERSIRRYERASDVAQEIMEPYLKFVSWRYECAFSVKIKGNTVSQRVNRCGMTIITFTGDLDSSDVQSMYR